MLTGKHRDTTWPTTNPKAWQVRVETLKSAPGGSVVKVTKFVDYPDKVVHLTHTTPRTGTTASAFALAAALAWLHGSSIAAGALTQITTAVNPDNVLGALVAQGAQAGVDPAAFRGMIADMGLAQLRGES